MKSAKALVGIVCILLAGCEWFSLLGTDSRVKEVLVYDASDQLVGRRGTAI